MTKKEHARLYDDFRTTYETCASKLGFALYDLGPQCPGESDIEDVIEAIIELYKMKGMFVSLWNVSGGLLEKLNENEET